MIKYIWFFFWWYPIFAIITVLVQLKFKLQYLKVHALIKFMAYIWGFLLIFVLTNSIPWAVSIIPILYFMSRLMDPEMKKWIDLAEEYKKNNISKVSEEDNNQNKI